MREEIQLVGIQLECNFHNEESHDAEGQCMEDEREG